MSARTRPVTAVATEPVQPASPAPATAWVGLGANLGEPLTTLRAALDALDHLPGTCVVARSSWYRSAPVDANGPDFVNGVAKLQTTLAPLALLHALQAIEQAHGRERPYRHAPRTLDLDLLLHGEHTVHTDELVLPHPRLQRRAFVLQPLAEMDPELILPGLGPVAHWLTQAHITAQTLHRLDDVPVAVQAAPPPMAGPTRTSTPGAS